MPLIDSLAALTDLPGVRPASDAARERCTQLRFHEALRRRIPEAAAESRVRGARESAMLEGAQWPLDRVREVMTGAASWPTEPSPVDSVVRGAAAATAESERVAQLLRTAPMQGIARLHVAAMGHVLPAEQVGRPRGVGEGCQEFTDLGPAPDAAEARERLVQVAAVIGEVARAGGPVRGAGGGASARELLAVPAVVVLAVAHAEIATARPFVRGNGLVARALERALLVSLGLESTGVCVPEAGHTAGGGPAYTGALAAYSMGGSQGVALWIERVAEAVGDGVVEGVRICDAVRAGRLTGT